MVDYTLEGLMHAPETPDILKAGASIQVIANEYPEALERLRPTPALEKSVKAAVKILRGRENHARVLLRRGRAVVHGKASSCGARNRARPLPGSHLG